MYIQLWIVQEDPSSSWLLATEAAFGLSFFRIGGRVHGEKGKINCDVSGYFARVFGRIFS